MKNIKKTKGFLLALLAMVVVISGIAIYTAPKNDDMPVVGEQANNESEKNSEDKADEIAKEDQTATEDQTVQEDQTATEDKTAEEEQSVAEDKTNKEDKPSNEDESNEEDWFVDDEEVVEQDKEDKPSKEDTQDKEEKPSDEDKQDKEEKPSDEDKQDKEEKPSNEDKQDKEEKPSDEDKDKEEKPDNKPTDDGLIEGPAIVDNGDLLRASTYSFRTAHALAAAAAREGETSTTTTLKYFPVTMYDYDAATINAATDALDDDLTLREGLYFTGGSPEFDRLSSTEIVEYTVEDGAVVIPDGTYYLYCSTTSYYVKDEIVNSSPWNSIALNGTSTDNIVDASLFTFTRQEDGTYTIQDDEGRYLIVLGEESATMSATENTVSIEVVEQDAHTFKIYDEADGTNTYLNSLGNYQYGHGYFGGWSAGSSFQLHSSGENKITSGYEEWNRWDKAGGGSEYGDYIYTGLVENALLDDEIVFNVNEGGIFNNDTSVKKIYEYVGLPFVLGSDGFYTFDSDVNGVYFADTDGDGGSNPQSGTKDSPYNMYFHENTPQLMTYYVGDKSLNAWFPFNTIHSGTHTDGNDPVADHLYGDYSPAVNHHFGMRADIPFSMTPNGRVQSTNNESTPISFTFSGDDDVWVFIDGKLVIDLGGIHNRLDVTIDFAANTVTYSEENGADDNNETASYNDSNFAMVQKLFTDTEGAGLLPVSREDFAVDVDHEMSVFYLERGEGTSNCQIEFNLPMHDEVRVTKDATQSWSQANKDDADEGVDPLTATEQAIVDNIPFGFTLYKKTANSEEFSPVANTNFYLLNEAGEVESIPSTDANGRFYLKNKQTAKFVTDIPGTGVTYYVVEDQVPDGFVTPDFNYDGEATSGYDYLMSEGGSKTHVAKGNEIPEQEIHVEATVNKSYEVTVYGSIEATDTIEFICSNFLDAELPNPTALTIEDMIVIDYGLPVQIAPLENDVVRGDTAEIVYIGGEDDIAFNEYTGEDGIVRASWTGDDTYDFGNVTLNKVDYSVNSEGKVTGDTLVYSLNKPLTEVEILTYVLKVTGSTTQEATGGNLKQYDYAVGKIYIVPATTMYYEENFSDLVTFAGAGWDGKVEEATYTTPYQEPGVVGTTTDSTYGSDKAYLSDSKDSNGTSYYGDTTNGAIRFSYTFTGTGTTFFARTSAKTGYMQVRLYEGVVTEADLRNPDFEKLPFNTTYRDTYYEDKNGSTEDANGILYNIPVYTESNLHYGTYTVVATIAKAGTKGAGGASGSGNEFYLDGIRVMKPLNENNDKVIHPAEVETGKEAVTITQKALSAYSRDGEANIEVVTLRQKLITDAELGETPWNFAVLTDTNGEIKTAEEYTNFGPKEEVYLENGQSVRFSLKYWKTDGMMLYMGMKAPFGSGSVQVGQTTYNLENAADCYYDITQNSASLTTKYEQATDDDNNLLYQDDQGNRIYENSKGELFYVSNDTEVPADVNVTPVDDTNKPYFVVTYEITAKDSIVSLTNLKVTGNYEFTIIDAPHYDGDRDINVSGYENADE